MPYSWKDLKKEQKKEAEEQRRRDAELFLRMKRQLGQSARILRDNRQPV